jgi:branched-chain amino acid transport system ATP-binding protein
MIRSPKDSGMATLLIEHKLSLVMELSDRVVVLDDGRVISKGTPSAVRSDPAVLEAYLGHRAVGASAQDPGERPWTARRGACSDLDTRVAVHG